MHAFAILMRLAWRNLWRNHRRTLIMLLAVVLGAWAMIFMTALMRGMVSQMVSDGSYYERIRFARRDLAWCGSAARA